MVTLLLLVACQDAVNVQSPRALDDVAVLTRISLDLRGVRPSLDEIHAVQADPAVIEGLADSYVKDPRFGERVRDLYADIYHTRFEHYYVTAEQYGLDDNTTFETSVGEQPLEMISYAAENDLPYTDLVTGDWTMSDEVLASVWPVDYPADATGWQRVHWTDGRPAAGLLASTTLWWRYYSNASNANRGRANQISRIFLCNDYLTHPIDFDQAIDLLDEQARSEAIRANPTCVACHASIEPLAGYLYGFWWFDYPSSTESTAYHPERELLWEEYSGTPPGYFGEPGWTLRDLGQQLAGDDRLIECAVKQVYQGLLRREAGVDDLDALVAYRDTFLASGLHLRALFRAIVNDPRYRADGSTEGQVDRKMLTPDALRSEVEDLTGFTWTWDGFDMLGADDIAGFRTLAGGADSYSVMNSATEPNATVVLVQERLAELASAYVVDQDRALAPEDRRLFKDIDFTETPDDGRDAMVTQLLDLHLRVLDEALSADGAILDEDLQVWSELYALDGNPSQAWAGLLAILMREPDFLFD